MLRAMLRAMFVVLLLSTIGLAQASSDRTFSVRHAKNTNFSLSPAQIREAESIYRNACVAVQHAFHMDAAALHPRLTVVVGTDHDEVHSRRTEGGEIWMKRWNTRTFAQGVVVLAFDQALTPDVIAQLSNRAVRYSNATVDVSELK